MLQQVLNDTNIDSSSSMIMASSEERQSPAKLDHINKAYDVQQMYLKQLEDNYQGEKKVTKAKKFKIIRAAKIV